MKRRGARGRAVARDLARSRIVQSTMTAPEARDVRRGARRAGAEACRGSAEEGGKSPIAAPGLARDKPPPPFEPCDSGIQDPSLVTVTRGAALALRPCAVRAPVSADALRRRRAPVLRGRGNLPRALGQVTVVRRAARGAFDTRAVPAARTSSGSDRARAALAAGRASDRPSGSTSWSADEVRGAASVVRVRIRTGDIGQAPSRRRPSGSRPRSAAYASAVQAGISAASAPAARSN